VHQALEGGTLVRRAQDQGQSKGARQGSRFKQRAKKASTRKEGQGISKRRREHKGKGCLASMG
jgi:hypothetical protein